MTPDEWHGFLGQKPLGTPPEPESEPEKITPEQWNSFLGQKSPFEAAAERMRGKYAKAPDYPEVTQERAESMRLEGARGWGELGQRAASAATNLPHEIAYGIPGRAMDSAATFSETGVYDPAPVMEAVTTLATTGMPFAGKGQAGIFGGELAASRMGRSADLSFARMMERRGIDVNQIYKETGFWRGEDGKWRFEIPDTKAKITGLPREMKKVHFPPGTTHEEFITPIPGETYPLAQAIEHPELSQAYPAAEQLTVKRTSILDNTIGSYGEGEIHLAPAKTDQALSTLLHELQHYVQEMEGFAMGGTVTQFTPKRADRYKKIFNDVQQQLSKDLKSRGDYDIFLAGSVVQAMADPKKQKLVELAKNNATFKPYVEIFEKNPELKQRMQKWMIAKENLEIVEDHAFNNYRRLEGELESRTVQARAKMTPEELKAEPPYVTRQRLLEELPENMRESIVQYSVPKQPD